LQIGIVGRTGSGKTTLLMALFRMIGLAGGRIVMDGVDIGSLPLREVGAQLSSSRRASCFKLTKHRENALLVAKYLGTLILMQCSSSC
jgi:ABC-type multidrug transport system fused ATPase/permease subunit